MKRDPLPPASFGRPGRAPARDQEPLWYACRTRARAEKQVERLLARTGLETFLPLVELERAWSDRTKRVTFPLFPGYTFARFGLGERFLDVVCTPGLVEVVGGRERPRPVQEDELEAVRLLVSRARAGGDAVEPLDQWEPGVRVVITRGPFRGMQGELVEVRSSTRLAVRLSAIRMAASVEIDATSVREVA